MDNAACRQQHLEVRDPAAATTSSWPSASGTNDRAMTSSDGITWTAGNTSNANQSWYGVATETRLRCGCPGGGSTGTLNRVMTPTTCCSHSPATPSGGARVVFHRGRVPINGLPDHLQHRCPDYCRKELGCLGVNWASANAATPPPKRSAARGNTTDINLATYRDAKLHRSRGGRGRDNLHAGHRLPAGLGVLGTGQSMPFKAQVRSAAPGTRRPSRLHHAFSRRSLAERQKALSQPSASG